MKIRLASRGPGNFSILRFFSLIDSFSSKLLLLIITSYLLPSMCCAVVALAQARCLTLWCGHQ